MASRPIALSDNGTHRVIVGAALSLLLCACSLVGLSLWYSVRTSDDLQLEHESAVIGNAISLISNRSLRELQSSVIWTEAFRRTRVSNDLDWFDENFRTFFKDLYGYDAIYVTDTNGKGIYGSIDGVRVAADIPASLQSALDSSLHSLYQLRWRGPFALSEAKLVVPLAGDQSVSFRGVTRLAKFDGKPVILTVATMVPFDESWPPEVLATPPFLVAVYEIDPDLVTRIGDQFGLKSLRWLKSEPKPEMATYVVRSAQGEPIGTLTWTAHRPGWHVLSEATGGMLAGLGVLSLFALAVITVSRHYISWLSAEKARAQYLAERDTLTDLANRHVFEMSISKSVEASSRNGKPCALLLLDLDDFKSLNDTLGHQCGDEALKIIAARIRKAVPEEGLLARLGGDEFAFLLPGIDKSHAKTLADWVIDSIREPLQLGNELTAHLGGSIGISLAPEDGASARELIRRADVALYRAKSSGRNCAVLFDDTLDAAVTRRHQVTEALRVSLAAGEVEVVYQPLMEADGRTIHGVEALARWRHPTLGSVSPGEFIPIAERTGLIIKLGDHVLRQACQDAVRWPGVKVAVNISAMQFKGSSLVDQVKKTLAATGLPANRLELEVTETALFDEESGAPHQLAELRALGVQVSLDDFGTGYSSLAYLRRFQFDTLKIDRGFVRDLGQSESACAIIQSIVDMSRALGLKVTAEGVETEAQHLLLQHAGCDWMQGYLFAPPLPREQVDKMLMQRAA